MGTPSHAIDAAVPSGRGRLWLGVVLLAVGLLGHLLAARAIGGYRLAYTHHVFGFFFILAVTGTLIAGLGWRFWRRGRNGTMWLVIGATQALLGIMVYVSTVRGLVH